ISFTSYRPACKSTFIRWPRWRSPAPIGLERLWRIETTFRFRRSYEYSATLEVVHEEERKRHGEFVSTPAKIGLHDKFGQGWGSRNCGVCRGGGRRFPGSEKPTSSFPRPFCPYSS